jgi:hypothetical protein
MEEGAPEPRGRAPDGNRTARKMLKAQWTAPLNHEADNRSDRLVFMTLEPDASTLGPVEVMTRLCF